ncbi:MAG: pentapeptide repeat-containing protein [Rickettsiales bacterium]
MNFKNILIALNRLASSNAETIESAVAESSVRDGTTSERLGEEFSLSRIASRSFSSVRGVAGIIGGLGGAVSGVSGELGTLYAKYNYIRSNTSEAILEILNEPEALKLLKDNSKIFTSVLTQSFLSGVKDPIQKQRIARRSEETVEKLVNVVGVLQQFIHEKEITSVTMLQEQILVASEKKGGQHITDAIEDVVNSFTDLAAMNPDIIVETALIATANPDDRMHKEKYQEAGIKAFKSLITQSRESGDLSEFFRRYRSDPDKEATFFLDSYVDHYVRKKSLAGIDIADVDCNSLKFQGFDFSFAKIANVDFSRSKIHNCDFSLATFDEGVDFDGAEIDVETFQTMIPSLREANKHGEQPKINCKIIGETTLLDLSGIHSDDLDLSDLRVVVLQREQHAIRSGDELEQRKQVFRFVRNNQKKIKEDLLRGQSGKIEDKQFFKHLEDSFYNAIWESCDSQEEVETFLTVIDESPESSKLFLECWDQIKTTLSYNEVGGGFFSSAETRPHVSSERLNDKLRELVDQVKHDPKFKFRDRLFKRPKTQDIGETLSGHPERVRAGESIFNFIFTEPFFASLFDPSKNRRPTRIGRKIREVFEKTVPSFAKPYFYNTTKAGRSIECWSIKQAITFALKLFRNRNLWRHILPVLNDLNYYSVWRKSDDLKRSRADVLYNLVENKVLRKNIAMRDEDGNPLRDAEGNVILNQNLIDVVSFVFDVDISRGDLETMFKSLYNVLEILEETKSHSLIREIATIDSAHEFKQKLLEHLANKISKDKLITLEKDLNSLVPVVTKFLSKGGPSVEVEALPYHFAHVGSMEKMAETVRLMGRGGVVDIGERVFAGEVADFSYGTIGAKEEGIEFSGIKSARFNCSSSKFTNVKFSRCELSGEREEDIPAFKFLGPNFDHAKFADTTFESVMMPHFYGDCMEFKRGGIEGCDIHSSILTDASFVGTEIGDVDLSRSNMTDVVLDNVKISSNSKLNDVNLTNSHIVNSEILDVTFAESDLTKANIWKSSFVHTSFERVKLKMAEFSSVTLEDCSFKGADLYEVRLKDIEIRGSINLEGATISGDQLEIIVKAAERSGAEVLGIESVKVKKPKKNFVKSLRESRASAASAGLTSPK